MDKIYFETFKSSKENIPFRLQLLHHTQASPNWHDIPEFLYCLEGNGNMYIDENTFPFIPETLVAVNSNKIHYAKSSEGLLKYYCLKINRSFFSENGIDISSMQFSEIIQDTEASKIFNEIFDIYFNRCDNPKYVFLLRLKVLEFIYILWDRHSCCADKTPKESDKTHRLILETIKYINENFSQKIGLDNISAHFGYSKYHFARLFKQYTNRTITEHINILRCEKALVLLKSTQRTISDIASNCGFDGQSYFTETFRKIYGETPSEYRKSGGSK